MSATQEDARCRGAVVPGRNRNSCGALPVTTNVLLHTYLNPHKTRGYQSTPLIDRHHRALRRFCDTATALSGRYVVLVRQATDPKEQQ